MTFWQRNRPPRWQPAYRWNPRLWLLRAIITTLAVIGLWTFVRGLAAVVRWLVR